MKKIITDFNNMVQFFQQNKNFTTSFCEISKGYPTDELTELFLGLELVAPQKVIEFYSGIGSMSLIWNINPIQVDINISEDDLPFLTGSIQLLNPFDMVMGKAGTKWKDVLWFDNMENNEKEALKNFMPFDFPSTELTAGFIKTGGLFNDKLVLYTSNAGLSKIEFTFSNYLQKLTETKGFSYWQLFGNNEVADAERCYKKYTPNLFINLKK